MRNLSAKQKFFILSNNINITDTYDDGSISCDNVTISTPCKKLPIKFNKIYGDFIVNSVGLESCKNFPNAVECNIKVSGNNITSLRGFPQKARGDIDLSHNKITSIKELAGMYLTNTTKLNISSNNLTSLEGFPGYILNSVDISNNPLLKIDSIIKTKKLYMKGELAGLDLCDIHKFVECEFIDIDLMTKNIVYLTQVKQFEAIIRRIERNDLVNANVNDIQRIQILESFIGTNRRGLLEAQTKLLDVE